MRYKIIEVVNRVSDEDISIVSRELHYIKLRKIYYQLCKDFIPKISLEQIGIAVGNSHASVLHNLKKFYEILNDKHYLDIYNKCKSILSETNSDFNIQLSDKERDLIKIDLLKSDNIKLRLEVVKLKEDLNKAFVDSRYSSIINKLHDLNDKKLKELEKYRIEPFVKMNKL